MNRVYNRLWVGHNAIGSPAESIEPPEGCSTSMSMSDGASELLDGVGKALLHEMHAAAIRACTDHRNVDETTAPT